MRIVEVGQYFVTKDTGDFRQVRSVACREYTLPRDDPASQPKGWIQGNMRIGPVLELTTSFQHFKYGIEIRIESVNQDNSQSWVRISYETSHNTWSILFKTTQKFLQIHKKRQVPQTSTNVVAARSKAKEKPQPRVLVGTTATIPIHERRWIDIEPSRTKSCFVRSLEESNRSSSTQSNVTARTRWSNWISQNQILIFEIIIHKYRLWSDDRWKGCLAAGGGSKRRYQYCSDNLGTILYLRALQGHSGNNLIDPMLQDNVVIGTGIIPYIYHIGCTFNLHSIINNGLVLGGQILSRWQTVFFLPVDPRDDRS